MIRDRIIDKFSKIIQYILSGIYILVFLRFLVYIFDIQFYISNNLGNLAEYLTNFKAIIIDISNPIMYFPNKLFYMLYDNIDINIVNMLAPILVILLIIILKIFVQIITPYAKYYTKKNQ